MRACGDHDFGDSPVVGAGVVGVGAGGVGVGASTPRTAAGRGLPVGRLNMASGVVVAVNSAENTINPSYKNKEIGMPCGG